MSSGKKKLRVGVLYGGRSGEHEISLQSAASVIKNLDTSRYDILPIGIDKQGRWHVGSMKLIQDSPKTLSIAQDGPEMALPSYPVSKSEGSLDVIFPIMHGPLCEDGTIQGLLELSELPYVGSGVLASAVGMDKDVAKRLARDSGIPVVPYVVAKKGQWLKDPKKVGALVEKEIGFPCFVKPSNMGSSVGVHKVKSTTDLAPALSDAFKYDSKVLIEKAIAAREIEVSVLENAKEGEPPLVSIPGEIAPTHEFYSYEAKYLDENGAHLMIPAKLDAKQVEQAQKIARDVFTALECEGMARVDMFLDKNSGKFYLNEINTLPGFTQISMYPKLWEASGVPYKELLNRLIELALERHRRKQDLSREYLP
ncbi:D-alanine--D-alanine ligase [bacterium]|nr:D-alanine--D-alanine ligase [bacterium]